MTVLQTVYAIARFHDGIAQRSRQRMDALSDFFQSFWTVVYAEHTRHDAQQNLRGADV